MFGTEMTLTAEIPATKTANSGMATVWASGDELSAIHIKTGHSTNYVSKFTYVSGNKFTGEVSSLGDNNDWYVVYPYNSDNKKAASVSVSVNAAPSQAGVNSTAHLAGENFPLFGKKLNAPKAESGVEITMTNALAVAKFVVTNTLSAPITVTGVEFTSVKEIAGDFTVDMTKDDFAWSAKSGASKKISLSVSGEATIAAGATGTFYAGIVPHDIPSGSNIVVAVKAKRSGASEIPCYISKTMSAAATFTAGLMKDIIVNYDEDHKEDPTGGSKGYKLITSEPTDWSGRYIMVSANKDFIFTADKSTSNKYELQSSDIKDGVITKDCSAYEFTISKDGSNYYLMHNSQYLYCSFSGSGSSSTGVAYSSSKQALGLKVMEDGTFGFWMSVGSTDQCLYYKSSSEYFKFGGSHDNHCVYLYKYDDGGTPVPPTPTGDQYVKITSAPTSWDGTYLFVDESSSKAFDVYSSSTSSYAVSVTINDGKIAAGTDINKYALTVTSTGKTHVNVGQPSYNVQNSNGKYIFYSDSEINISDVDYKDKGSTYGTVTYNHCFAYQDGGVQVLSSGNYTDFTKYYLYYSSSKFNYSSTERHKIQLYKLESTGGKEIQSISFATSSVTWTLGDTYKIGSSYDFPQSVSGAKTAVTYTSGNTSVATIESNSKIKIVAPGTVTITASAAETTQYQSATASYTLTIKEAGSSTKGYELVTAEPSNWSGKFIMVSPDKKLVFTGDNSTSNKYELQSSDLKDGVITKDCSAYEFTISKDGSNYYLLHDGKYLYCSYSGSTSTGMQYSSSKQALSFKIAEDGTFGFWMREGSTDQYIYYKSSSKYFKFGGSHDNHFVYLYRWNDGTGKQYQNLSFDSATATMKIGSTYSIGGTYAMPQTVKGAQTAVTYSSSNTTVATVSGTNVTIVGTGSTTITANAAESTTYYAGSANYTLNISKEGAFNLENTKVKNYFDDAATSYTDDNYTSKTVVSNYTSGQSSSNRLDAPAPVSLSWTSSASGTRTVYVYNNSAMTDLEMSTTTSGNSVDILNLAVNQTYYYKVATSSSTITTGSFSTEGRRRMVKVSDTRANGHANNCRDFGGLKTTDGKTVKCGMIFRGTNMDATTDTEKDYITEYMNVALDVDLRNGSTSRTPGIDGSSSAYNAFNGTRGVEYVKGNFSGYISDFYTTNSNAKTSMTNIFTKILATFKAGKAVYIHCYVGADRTGYTSMILQAALGVSPKDCSIDFELTSFSVVGTRTRTGGGNSIGKDGLNYINNYSKGSTFKEKAYNILRDYGITDAQITEFRNYMLQ